MRRVVHQLCYGLAHRLGLGRFDDPTADGLRGPWEVHGADAEDELRGAQEIILGSAGGGLRAVTTLDGHQVGDGRPGPVFSALYRAWIGSLAEFCTECRE